jgi:hypothetical protein
VAGIETKTMSAMPKLCVGAPSFREPEPLEGLNPSATFGNGLFDVGVCPFLAEEMAGVKTEFFCPLAEGSDPFVGSVLAQPFDDSGPTCALRKGLG